MNDLGAVSNIVAGAIGEPGDRTFLIEVRKPNHVSWYVLEKRQVAALALESAQLLETTGFTDAGAGLPAPDLAYPETVSFRVGQIDITYSEDEGVIELVLHSVSDDEEPVRFSVTPAQLDRMARAAAESVGQGRPACPRCGLAMDSEGHACPVDNGDLRAHRP